MTNLHVVQIHQPQTQQNAHTRTFVRGDVVKAVGNEGLVMIVRDTSNAHPAWGVSGLALGTEKFTVHHFSADDCCKLSGDELCSEDTIRRMNSLSLYARYCLDTKRGIYGTVCCTILDREWHNNRFESQWYVKLQRDNRAIYGIIPLHQLRFECPLP